jgi:predicted nucleic acid-binding protein
VILTDTGPLVALLNRNDPNHALCMKTAGQLPRAPLVTTWPSFTEAMYLLLRGGGFQAQATLWALRDSGRLLIHTNSDSELQRMQEYMAKYQDLPMDLADSSLMAAAEHLNSRRIFTLDGDFRIYRFADGSSVDVIP